MNKFRLKSQYHPSGDQPKAIKSLVNGLTIGRPDQMLLGITGSGKTFVMANIIKQTGRPALIMAHNKTLAAQLYSELKNLFPDNAVEYFISYYDYYQPESYISRTNTFIEKDSSINEQISLMRHSTTRSLMSRKDVIVVSSISCIYGLGSPELYSKMIMTSGKNYRRKEFLDKLINLQYRRNDNIFERGTFRVTGENIDIFPSHSATQAWRLVFFGDDLEYIDEFDPLTGEKIKRLSHVVIYSNSHFVTSDSIIKKTISGIENELHKSLTLLKETCSFTEADRLEQRTQYDIEMLKITGTCKGIENYSRYLTGRTPGIAPPTLFEYLAKDTILFVDESHVMVPQIKAMYQADKARKTTLIKHGFRLPSSLDNRPLKFEEWIKYKPQTIFVSATPGEFELEQTAGWTAELIIRPTGLLDPECIIQPATTQIENLVIEIRKAVVQDLRVLVTTLTKKMAEDLTCFLQEQGQKVSYLHSNVQTFERVEIISNLKSGVIDTIIGVNLLREGLDIPECGLVAILDADKEGFLRSETSLIQTIGRASRNSKGKVLLYADIITDSLERAISKTKNRRNIQVEYNKRNGIIPETITSKKDIFLKLKREKKVNKEMFNSTEIKTSYSNLRELKKTIHDLHLDMLKAAKSLSFEEAATLRDQIIYLKKKYLIKNPNI